MSVPMLKAVLFDLDGTLIDSAPDLAGTGNEMRVARGLEPLPYERFRALVGTGARGMVKVALDVTPEDPQFTELRDEFFARYEARMTRETALFDTMRPVLDALRARGLPWGIVTNKSQRFTTPLVNALGLDAEAACVVSGDTTPHAKPHPEPLLEAARRLKVDPSACMYVGDDLRDVQAGRAAGMLTVAASWGYLGADAAITEWNAHHVIDFPGDLLKLPGMA
jgi:N-acetyl-D-muramate 6-phosphate phosphatase